MWNSFIISRQGQMGRGGGTMNTIMSRLVPSTTMNFLRNAQAIYSYLKNDFTILRRRGWSSQVSLLEKNFFQPPPLPTTSEDDVLIRRLRSRSRST